MPARVDLARLREFSDGTPEGLRELVEIFLSDSAQTMRELAAAVREGAAAQVELLAHRAGGSSAACGAARLSDLLFDLERLGRARAVAGAGDVMRAAEAEFVEIQAVLGAHLGKTQDRR